MSETGVHAETVSWQDLLRQAFRPEYATVASMLIEAGVAISSGVAAASLRLLARRKIAVAQPLGSRAMPADAMESVTCGSLSLVVLIGIVAHGRTGAWWIDPVASSASSGSW